MRKRVVGGRLCARVLAAALSAAMVFGSVATVPQMAYAAEEGGSTEGNVQEEPIVTPEEENGGAPESDPEQAPQPETPEVNPVDGGQKGPDRAPRIKHNHSWSYSDIMYGQNVIYAYCTNVIVPGCDHYLYNPLKLTVTADDGTAGETYNGLHIDNQITPVTGEPYTVTYWNYATGYQSSTPPTEVGTYTVMVTMKGQTAKTTFTISKKEITPTISFASQWVVNSNPADPTISGNDGNGAVTWYVKGASDTDYSATTIDAIKALPVGTYTLKASVAETASTKAAETNEVTFEVIKENVDLSVSMDGWTYGSTANEPSVTPTTAAAEIKYYTDAACTVETTAANGAATNGGKPANAGTYYVKATVAETATSKAAEATCSFTISKATIGLQVSIDDWTYGDTAKDPSITPTTTLPTGVTFIYKYYTDAACTVETSRADGARTSGDVPANAGTYYIKASIPESANYQASSATDSFEIKQKSITAKVSATDRVYDGTTDATVTATVNATDLVNQNDQITISGLKGTFEDKNVGTDKNVTVDSSAVAIAGNGSKNYKVTIPATTTSDITAKPVTLTWSGDTTLYYTGKPQGVSATVNDVETGDTVNVVYATGETHEASAVGSYKAEAASLDNANYKLADTAVTTCDWEIKYASMGDAVISGTKGNNDWYVSDVEVAGDPATQYEISTDETNWQSALTYTEDGEHEVTYYLRDTKTGYISEQKTATFKIDRTHPEGEIEAGSSTFDTFLSTITFNHYYKHSVKVTISGKDATSGIASIEYQKVSSADQYDEKDGKWTTLDLNKDNAGSFNISAEDKAIIYARITDKAGNVTIINSDGLVIYKDYGPAHKEHKGGYGDVTLYNVSADGKFLPGAVFALYKSNDDYVGTYTVDEHGMIVLKNLAASTYYFKQVKAADGYAMTYDPIRFSLEDEQILGIKVTSDLIATVYGTTQTTAAADSTAVSSQTNGTATAAQGGTVSTTTAGISTGDNSNMMLYGIVAAMAAVMLAAWVVINRKRQNG